MHDTVVNSKIGSTVEAKEDMTVTPLESFVSYLNNVIILFIYSINFFN